MRAFVSALLLGLAACGTSTTQRLKLPPLAAVEKVDLSRYLGTWFEIASFPQSFQKGCTATSAHYAPGPNGEIVVTNRCRQDRLDGKLKEARGRARIVDTATNAKLEVSFFGPFWGSYWVIDLGQAYEYAVVGHPGRDYLWILSRTRAMDPAVYEAILGRLTSQGYQTERLVTTLQPADDGAPVPASAR